MELSTTQEATSCVARHSIASQHFMEHKGSLPQSQELSNCPYPEPDQSSQNPATHSISPRSILILATHLLAGLPSGLLPSGFPTNNLYAFLFTPIHATCIKHLTLLNLYILIFTFFNIRRKDRRFWTEW
jgi:hypothetical protein